jgi:RHS repeat-associated protein
VCTTNVTRTDSSTVGYTYDGIGQLTIADSSVAAEDMGYYYDAAWNLNRRTNNGSTKTFVVNTLNELTNASSPLGEMSYDANGNLTNISGFNWDYVYDDENRLYQLYQLNQSPEKATEFVYDGVGRLKRRLEYHWELWDSLLEPIGDGYWELDSETRYIYDGWRVIQERVVTGSGTTPTVSYTRGTDLSGSLEGAGGIGGLLARSHGYSGGNWSTHTFYHADGNGNITYLVNSSQTGAASYRYDPFGNLVSSSGSLAAANVYRFSSKEIHVNSGMYYYGYRFYDPNLQRWLNRDPRREEGFAELVKVPRRGGKLFIDRSRRLGTKQNFENTYGFTFNSPPSRIDSWGLDAPGCTLPFNVTNPCLLECCADHDSCYDDHDCCSSSWLNPLPCLTPCGQCNLDVIGCWIDCPGEGDDPDHPNYYCCQCHEYFDLLPPATLGDSKRNPHFGHSCNNCPPPGPRLRSPKDQD